MGNSLLEFCSRQAHANTADMEVYVAQHARLMHDNVQLMRRLQDRERQLVELRREKESSNLPKLSVPTVPPQTIDAILDGNCRWLASDWWRYPIDARSLGDAFRDDRHGGAGNPAGGRVAVKMMLSNVGTEERQILREVQAYSTVRHKNILPLLAICVPRLALVYPWADRGSLEHVLRSEPPGPKDGFQLLLGVAGGLHALHSHRLVHRDVNSGGIFLFSPAGGGPVVAKLGGCGWARELDQGASTQAGTLVGEPQYQDPFYAHFKRFSQASDVFSLGVVTLELLLGRPARQLASSDAWRWWVQYASELPLGRASAYSAAGRVRQERPDAAWDVDALVTATGLLQEMLRLEWRGARGDEQPGRPSAIAVARRFEVIIALQSAEPAPELDPEENTRLCVVCMDNPITTQLRPCLHSALCAECSAGLVARGAPCPICRRQVAGYEEGQFQRTFEPS